MTDTDMGTRPHNARAILQEALDTIRATYWIQRSEAKFAHLNVWDDTDKAIMASIDAEGGWSNVSYYTDDEHDNKAKVVGVCSIGALALANVTLYDEPLLAYELIVNRDIETWKAAQALAQSILADAPTYLTDSAGALIANWNDEDGRTRDEVVAAFEKALSSSLLTASDFYQIVVAEPDGYGDDEVGYFLTSEQQAQDFITTPSRLRDCAMSNLAVNDPAQLTVRKFVHESLVGA